MALWNRFRSLVGIIAVVGTTAGMTSAAPPISPLVEGREPDPVAREFYLPDQPPSGYVSGSEHFEQSNADLWFILAVGIWDGMLDRLTIPLGAAIISDELQTIRQ